jgi:hypothetical protein
VALPFLLHKERYTMRKPLLLTAIVVMNLGYAATLIAAAVLG